MKKIKITCLLMLLMTSIIWIFLNVKSTKTTKKTLNKVDGTIKKVDVYTYIKAVEDSILMYKLENNILTIAGDFKISHKMIKQNDLALEINIRGTFPKAGYLNISEAGEVLLIENADYGKYYVNYNSASEKIDIKKK